MKSNVHRIDIVQFLRAFAAIAVAAVVIVSSVHKIWERRGMKND